jgi:hypothetical protein
VKNWLVTLLAAVAVCAASFGAFYAVNREPAEVRAAAHAGDALEWMRAEFHLTDEQFAAIKRLHMEYGATCNEHCREITVAEQRHASPAELQGLERTCVQSMTEHFHRVASLMAPDQGARYLAIVLPRIQDYDHRGAPNVQGRR